MNNFQLITINPKLSGNASFSFNIDKMNIGDTFISGIQNEYHEPIKNIDKSYSKAISKYYNKQLDDFYDQKVNPLYRLNQSLPSIDLGKRLQNRIVDFEYGMSRVNLKTYNKAFKIFAPLYIEDLDKIPNKIRLEIKMLNNDKIYTHTPINIDVNISDIIKPNLIQDKQILCLPNDCKILGWSVKDGSPLSINTNLNKLLYAHDITFFEWNTLICNEYKRQEIINQHIYNFSFYFNLEDIVDEITLSNFNEETKYSINLSYIYDNEKLQFRDLNNNLTNWYINDINNNSIDILSTLNEKELIESTDHIIKRNTTTFSIDYVNDYIFNNYKNLSEYDTINYSNNFNYTSTNEIENLPDKVTRYLIYDIINNKYTKPSLSKILNNRVIINYTNNEKTQGICVYRGVKYFITLSETLDVLPLYFSLAYDTNNHSEYNLINSTLIMYTNTNSVKSFIDSGEFNTLCPILGTSNTFNLSLFGNFPTRIHTQWYLLNYDKVQKENSFTIERYIGWIKPTLIDLNNIQSHPIYHKEIDWIMENKLIIERPDNFTKEEIKNFKNSYIYKLDETIEREFNYDISIDNALIDIQTNELHNIQNALYNYTFEIYKNENNYKIILQLK